jgi:hypothetical protein
MNKHRMGRRGGRLMRGHVTKYLCVQLTLATTFGGCAAQRPDEVNVRLGFAPGQIERSYPYSALYAPYAMMAALAYTDPDYLDKIWKCPARTALKLSSDRNSARYLDELTNAHWSCEYGMFGNLPCPKNRPDCHPLSGLEFHVWRRTEDSACKEIVIAFRGSDSKDPGDWKSNFRWFRVRSAEFDQYAQVRAYIEPLVYEGRIRGCRNPERIIAVGHSLGGGLAQMAAYAYFKVRYVYAFDTSPVTGLFDLPLLLRNQNRVGLGIDRVHEQGEILAPVRAVTEIIFPPTDCNPQIRIVRFNTIATGSLVAQHNIEQLTDNLIEQSRVAKRQEVERVKGYKPAANCALRI